jgi:alanine dehydrogenase
MSSTIPTSSEDDVAATASIPAVIDSLRLVLRHEAEGTARNIDKTLATWPDARSAHALGAVDTDEGLVVFKTWVNTPAGAAALASAFDARDGRILGTFEAGRFGTLRTSAISAVATDLLADPAADELTIVGTGRQAFGQVEAVAAVRALRRVRVWSPDDDRREAFVARVHAELGLPAEAVPTLEAATADAPIVTVVTRARDPFLGIGHLAAGTHLNAVCALLPANAELLPDVLPAADVVVVDSVENARRASRELREHLDADGEAPTPLAEVVVGKVVRPPGPRLTVFKSMGMGLSDLAVARLLVPATRRRHR